MKGPDKTATVIRKGDGSHVVREEKHIPLAKKCFLFGLPFIRGIFVFASSIYVGVRQIMFSASEADIEEEEKPSKFDKWVEDKIGSDRAEKIIFGISLVLGIALPVFLFILLPTLLSSLFKFRAGLAWLRSALESVIRIAVFILFIYITSKQKDMKRVYAYHGAEHKAIHCYEAGEELTVENVRRYSRKHARCGTSFLFTVILVSIIVFSFVSVENAWARTLMRLVLLPVVVNLSYEFNRIIGKYDNALTLALRSPGLALQSLTTNEPDDDMISVAIDALKRVIPKTRRRQVVKHTLSDIAKQIMQEL